MRYFSATNPLPTNRTLQAATHTRCYMASQHRPASSRLLLTRRPFWCRRPPMRATQPRDPTPPSSRRQMAGRCPLCKRCGAPGQLARISPAVCLSACLPLLLCSAVWHAADSRSQFTLLCMQVHGQAGHCLGRCGRPRRRQRHCGAAGRRQLNQRSARCCSLVCGVQLMGSSMPGCWCTPCRCGCRGLRFCPAGRPVDSTGAPAKLAHVLDPPVQRILRLSSS